MQTMMIDNRNMDKWTELCSS